MEMKHCLRLILILSFLPGLLAGLFPHAAVSAGSSDVDSINDPYRYCDIFHVPQGPVPTFSPKPYLGIYLETKKVEKIRPSCREATYVAVAGVVRESPAAHAGLQKGDVILSLNDRPACTDQGGVEDAFRKAIEKLPIGAEIRLEVLRKDTTLFLKAKTVARPHHDQPAALHKEVPTCSGPPSLLASSLESDGTRTLFQDVVDGLHHQSNQVHNFNSPLEKPFHPLQLKEATYLLRYPLTAGVVAQEISRRLAEPVRERGGALGDVLLRAAALADMNISACAPPEEITFPALLKTIEEAAEQVRAAMRRLPPKQQTLLREKALSPWDDPQWNAILELSPQVERRSLFLALARLIAFLRPDHLNRLKEDLRERFGNGKEAILYQAETSAGLVIVGGERPKVYDRDAALILDLGGHNLYLNNAGGTRPDIPVSLVIDWGGHNRYIARDAFSQGAGLFGGGFLLDLGGHSTFVALDGSQGAGFWGVGLLYHGEGSNVFQARSFSQGVGQMGIGALVGQGGHNGYACLDSGQALGLFGGAGLLINTGGHNTFRLGGLKPDFRDPTHATVSMGQGFGYGLRTEGDKMGVPGGIGVLIAEKGNDTFIADYFAQGSAYYYGVGILDDRGGNNRYVAGRYAQGAGIHTAVGVLLNRGGKSSYFASVGVSQGMGHDYGVGFLRDDLGDSDYQGGALVQGAATKGGLGILADLGKKSRFGSGHPGQGSARDDDCLGILIRPGGQEYETTTYGGETIVRVGRKPGAKGTE